MGACGVPSSPSFVITPALPRMGAADADAMLRLGSDDIPPVDAAAPAGQEPKRYEQPGINKQDYRLTEKVTNKRTIPMR